jgi:hypothetical protein
MRESLSKLKNISHLHSKLFGDKSYMEDYKLILEHLC